MNTNLNFVEVARCILSENHEESLNLLKEDKIDIQKVFQFLTACAVNPHSPQTIPEVKKKIEGLISKAEENKLTELAKKISAAIPLFWNNPETLKAIEHVQQANIKKQQAQTIAAENKIDFETFSRPILKSKVGKHEATNKVNEINEWVDQIFNGEKTIKSVLESYKKMKKDKPDFGSFLNELAEGFLQKMESREAALTILTLINQVRDNMLAEFLPAFFQSLPTEIKLQIKEFWISLNKPPFPYD